MSWGRGPKKAKKAVQPPSPLYHHAPAMRDLWPLWLSCIRVCPSLSCDSPFFQSRCQGHPQARRGTDVRVQGYFHVQHKTSTEPAIFTDAMGHRRLLRKMSRKDGNHGGLPLDIDVLEFIRFHPLEQKLCLDSKNGQVYIAKTANELLLIKRHDNDIDLISLSNLFQAS